MTICALFHIDDLYLQYPDTEDNQNLTDQPLSEAVTKKQNGSTRYQTNYCLAVPEYRPLARQGAHPGTLGRVEQPAAPTVAVSERKPELPPYDLSLPDETMPFGDLESILAKTNKA